MSVLEIGGGDKPCFRPNMDCRALPTVDIVADLEKPFPLNDASYDFIYSNFVIEHISWRNLRQFISEVYRILKVGGRAQFVTANLLEQARTLATKTKWTLEDVCMVFGGQDYPENSHKSSMSPELAVQLFEQAGFTLVTVDSLPNCITDMIITAWKGRVEPRVSWILGQLGDSDKIVDIGCGNGWVLRGHRANVTYVDSESQLLPNFVQADAATVDTIFSEKQFDVAVLAELLEHVADPVAVLRSAIRIAKRLVITTPNEFEWSENIGPFKSASHIRHYTQDLLCSHLKEAGLKGFVGVLTVNVILNGNNGRASWFVALADSKT